MSELNWNEALKGWKVTFSIGHRPSDRWEVYTPKGCGGVVAVDSVTDWTVRELLDRMSATPVVEPSPWTGDGLPPVGTVCEWFSEDYGWLGGRVVGHDGSVSVISHNDGYTGCHPHQVRPIRTPEQIAEEERKAAVMEIAKTVHAWIPSSVDSMFAAHAIWDAGYRKAGDA